MVNNMRRKYINEDIDRIFEIKIFPNSKTFTPLFGKIN